MGQWVMGQWVMASWVTSPMGQMGHGSRKVTHCHICQLRHKLYRLSNLKASSMLSIYIGYIASVSCDLANDCIVNSYIVTRFPCRYWQKAGFAGPWERAMLTRQRESASPVMRTRQLETADEWPPSLTSWSQWCSYLYFVFYENWTIKNVRGSMMR